MVKKKRPGLYVAWIDLLIATLSTYAFLFFLSFVLIHPPEQPKAGIESKAEFVVTMTWPGSTFDDIDLHTLMPDGRMVNFRSREVGYCMLDHDDMGLNGVYVGSDGQPHIIDDHREMMSVRAIVPGTYVINVHAYRANTSWTTRESMPKLPYPVHVTLIKLNPRIETIIVADVMMSEVGQQKTAFAFTVMPDGQVLADNTADVPFIPMVAKPAEMGVGGVAGDK